MSGRGQDGQEGQEGGGYLLSQVSVSHASFAVYFFLNSNLARVYEQYSFCLTEGRIERTVLKRN